MKLQARSDVIADRNFCNIKTKLSGISQGKGVSFESIKVNKKKSMAPWCVALNFELDAMKSASARYLRELEGHL